MTKTLSTILLSIALLAVALFFYHTSTVDGAGWLPVHLQVATTTAVGPDSVVTLFDDETSPTCHSRVITTSSQGIRLSFGDTAGFGSTTLSNTVGHYQAASTSVVYDSALYGCGLMSAIGLVSSTTITISSF